MLKCAYKKHGAWWFNSWCESSNLNGKYKNKAAAAATFIHVDGITWDNWNGNWNPMKKTYMMIRRL